MVKTISIKKDLIVKANFDARQRKFRTVQVGAVR